MGDGQEPRVGGEPSSTGNPEGSPQVISWIQASFLCLAAIAVTVFACALTFRTQRRSPKSSSAGDAWRVEYDLELSELKSTVAGLSSTLRKLHGRESQRLKNSQTSELTDKNSFRQRYGIIPKVTE